MRKNFPIGTLVLFAILVSVAILVITFISKNSPQAPSELSAVLRPAPKLLQAFTFMDQKGKPYTQVNLKGKWTLLFFGYTNCPDICPTTLIVLASIIKQLETQPKSTKGVQVVFVSIDPQRDKPAILAKYLSYFHKDFIGITAGQDKTRALAGQFGAMYFKEKQTDSDNYLMAHASSIYLINPRTELVASFSPPHNYKTIASQILVIRNLKL